MIVKLVAVGVVSAFIAPASGTKVKAPVVLLTKSVPKGPVSDTSNITPSSTMLLAVPPLMPKVSAAPIGLLAEKAPVVGVKTSNARVSISVGPVTSVQLKRQAPDNDLRG